MNNEWRDMPTMADVSAAVVGHINEDGECYPVITVDCDQYYSGDSLNLAKFYAAANQSAILELIAAYRESIFCLAFANSKLKDIYSDTEGDVFNSLRIYASLAVAKRLGVE